jgi:hypothetical protein
MFKFVFLLSTFYSYYNTCNSQNSIEYSNIWYKDIMLPNEKFKSSKVQSVFIQNNNYENDLKTSTTQLFCDAGYLKWEKNVDSSTLMGGEVISVTYLDSSTRKVVRKISIADFDKIKKPQTSETFWSTYYYLGISSKKSIGDSLEFISYLKWQQDSSISFLGYLNGIKIDSGKTENVKSNLLSDDWICQKNVVKNLKGRDSIVSCIDKNSDLNFKKETYSFANNLVIKILRKSQFGKYKASSIEFRKYDTKKRLTEISVFDKENIIISKETFNYNQMTGSTKTIKKYEKGEMVSEAIFDLKGKILIERFPAKIRGNEETKILYTYYQNGLNKTIQKWYGNVLFSNINYSYTYY